MSFSRHDKSYEISDFVRPQIIVQLLFLDHTKKKKLTDRYYPSKLIRQDARPWLFKGGYEN